MDVGDEQWEQEFWEPRKIHEEKVCAQYAMIDNPVMVDVWAKLLQLHYQETYVVYMVCVNW